MFIKLRNIPQNLDEFSDLLKKVNNIKLEDYKTIFDLKFDYFKVFLIYFLVLMLLKVLNLMN